MNEKYRQDTFYFRIFAHTNWKLCLLICSVWIVLCCSKQKFAAYQMKMNNEVRFWILHFAKDIWDLEGTLCILHFSVFIIRPEVSLWVLHYTIMCYIAIFCRRILSVWVALYFLILISLLAHNIDVISVVMIDIYWL